MKWRTRAPKILLGALYVAVAVIYIDMLLANTQRIHEPRRFGDSDEYLRIARLPVFSADFWTQSKPVVAPLVFKLLQGNEESILVFQLWFQVACWIVLALAVSTAVRSFWLKPIAFALILAFSLSRDVFMWIPFIGSESVSFSVTALFLAAAIWLLVDRKAYKVALLLATAFLMAFSRDSLVFLLLFLAVAMVPFLWFTPHRGQLLVLICGFLAIFGLSTYAGQVARRFEVVFPIITGLRIFPNPEYVAFFRAHGMPIDEGLVQRSDPASPGFAKWDVPVALWSDPGQEPFRQWMRENGAATYAGFLWFFKQDTLQRMFIEDQGRNAFYPDVYYYTATGYRPILKDPRLEELFYPTRFGLLFFFLANLAAALALGFAIAQRRPLWLVPISMILLAYPQALLVWIGDVNDIPRHSVGHNILLRLGFWILVFFVLDTVWQSLKPRAEQGWAALSGHLPAALGRMGPSRSSWARLGAPRLA